MVYLQVDVLIGEAWVVLIRILHGFKLIEKEISNTGLIKEN